MTAEVYAPGSTMIAYSLVIVIVIVLASIPFLWHARRTAKSLNNILAVFSLPVTCIATMQRDLRKKYRAPFNAVDRLQAFARWREFLRDTFLTFNTVTSQHQQPQRLLHAITTTMTVVIFSALGLSSTTTDLRVARWVAGKRGMILVRRPKRSFTKTNRFRVLDISWIRDYPDEIQYRIFHHMVGVGYVISSTRHNPNHHHNRNGSGNSDQNGSGGCNLLSHNQHVTTFQDPDVLHEEEYGKAIDKVKELTAEIRPTNRSPEELHTDNLTFHQQPYKQGKRFLFGKQHREHPDFIKPKYNDLKAELDANDQRAALKTQNLSESWRVLKQHREHPDFIKPKYND